MGLLTAHPGKANASAGAIDASAPSNVAFQQVKIKRTFRPCKDFDIQLHEAMRRPPTANTFSVLQTDDDEADEPVATDPHLKPKSCSTPAAHTARRPAARKARSVKFCSYANAATCEAACCGARASGSNNREVWGSIGLPTDEARAETSAEDFWTRSYSIKVRRVTRKRALLDIRYPSR